MCWACDHPDRTRADYLNHLRAIIACYGWAVQGVERQGMRPPWAYTAGLARHGKPEIVVTGLPLGRAAGLAEDVAAHVMHVPAPPVPGEQVRLRGGRLAEFVKVAVPSAHLDIAAELFGRDIRALQVVHADSRGHWPWDRGYRGIRGGQPVLGPRSRTPVRTGPPGPGPVR